MDGGEWTGELLLLTLMVIAATSQARERETLMVGLTFEMGAHVSWTGDEAEEKRRKK